MRRVDAICPACNVVIRDRYVDGSKYPACPDCGTQTEWLPSFAGAMRKDSIEGGIWIAHGLCNPDGTPRRYDSRSEINLECKKRDLVPWGEVYSEDRTKDARVHADWQQSGEAKRAKQWRDEARREKRASR